MTTTVATIQATSPGLESPGLESPGLEPAGYESAESIQLKSHKAKVVVQRRSIRDLVSQSQLPEDHFPPSPAESESADEQMPVFSATSMEERRITRDVSRGSPGDDAILSDGKSPEQKELARKRSQYYEDAFAYRESVSTARERISRESMIMADIRTNVIIHDEYTFITDLSAQLSTRYQRPESSILVTVAHSACLLFGGNFDPAYICTVTALQSQLQPVTNKRNAALIQKAMEDTLGVGPDRGLVKFSPIAEENMATNGKTVAGEIEDLEKEISEETSSIRRSLSRSMKRKSTRSLRNLRISSPLPTHDEQVTPPVTAQGLVNGEQFSMMPMMPPMPTEENSLDRKAAKIQKMSRRKSFIASIFGK